MISETRFAKSYGSLWRSLAPTLELFVRKANLHLFERDWDPLTSTSAPASRAMINQVAFDAVQNAVSAFPDRLGRAGWFANLANLQECERRISASNDLSPSDLDEVKTLAERMEANLYAKQPLPVTLSPRYPGCGLINTCYGDGISDSLRFIELKDGDRPFRSYEFRQVIIYAALHLNSGGGLASEIQVINSRRGVSITLDFEEFSREIAGQSAYDLLTEVVRVISDARIYQS